MGEASSSDRPVQGADEQLEILEERCGHRFADRGLLERAITHNSWAVEAGTESNQTFEFLGDAVVDLAVSELLMTAHGACSEGELTRMRASIVSSKGLARAARELELGRWVRLGRGEERSGGRQKGRILADTYEAVIGAIYLDGGYAPARAAVVSHLGSRARDAESTGHDHKTDLQEVCQRVARRPPSYRVVDISGPDHARHYRVEISLGSRLLASGEGPNRKSAEQMAAKDAVTILRAGEQATEPCPAKQPETDADA